MPIVSTFNVFTGNFDTISVVDIATANGLSIDANQDLSLALATSSTPGAVLNIGSANGVATLDVSGKIPVAQLPSVVLEYEGLWDPSTNTPTLSDGTGTNGNVYYVSAAYAGPVAGLTDPSMVNFSIGNLVIYSAAVGKWQQTTPAAGVQSVNGAQGVVTVNAINQLTGDVTTSAASQSEPEASTVAAIQGTTVSGTTGTGAVVFSNSPTLSGTTNTGILIATSITDSSLTASTAIVTDGSSVLTSSPTTATELSYVSGVTSSIQTQINSLQPAGSYITALTGQVTASGPGSAIATIATNTVTNSNLAQVPTLTIKGNNTGSTANVSDLTVAQVNTILPVFTSTLNGLTPLSGGGTTNFLRADGTWTTAPGTGANTALSNLSAVAINTALLPGTSHAYDFGSTSFAWNNLWASGINANNTDLTLQSSNTNGNIAVIANGTGNLNIQTTIIRQSPSAVSASFKECQYFDTITLSGSVTSFLTISQLTFAWASFRGCFIDYVIGENVSSAQRTGRLMVASDGIVASSSDVYTETAILGTASGFALQAIVTGANVNIQFNNTTSFGATMRCEVTRFRA